jgi:ATP-binding cassette subfamily C protein CydC
MRALWRIFALILADQRRPLLRGAALGLLVLLMGAALLGLSGWFITAAAAAGLAGLGASFDVFRPSAMVRFLALGRTTARYGERLLTHDATLRGLHMLRLRLLSGLMAADWARMVRIRGPQALNRVTADIDALDGISLRLILPIAAGMSAQFIVFLGLWGLIGLPIALAILLGHLAAAAVVLWRGARGAAPLARRAERASQSFRAGMIDMIRGRADLAVFGQLGTQARLLRKAETRRLALRAALDRSERRAGAALNAASTLIAAATLAAGITAARSGAFSPALAATGFFVTLALAETLMPLRRAVFEIGRMAEAARRVGRDLAVNEPLQPQLAAVAKPARDLPEAPPRELIPPNVIPGEVTPGSFALRGLTLAHPGGGRDIVSQLSLCLSPGETLALTGASGAGKSTLLLAMAGLIRPASGQILLNGRALSDWDEAGLRRKLALLPQRSALMAGTIAENLRLAAPAASDGELLKTLDLVRMREVLSPRGGLDLRIGPRGVGLSGGEARRIALARTVLRRPQILLLDEGTEGLQAELGHEILRSVRADLPHAVIIIASHRGQDVALTDQIIEIR